VEIRPAGPSDYERLQEIEVRAGEVFRSVGLGAVADDEPFPVEELAAGDVRVAVVDGQVAGYVYSRVVDGIRHVEQVTVDPDFARRGIGARLLDHLGGPLTLTTFRDVPWNGPYYERIGFRVLEDPGPELRIQIDHEAWLEDLGPRIAMRRD
jgi:GNAT superfamily N-acetyltransferase